MKYILELLDRIENIRDEKDIFYINLSPLVIDYGKICEDISELIPGHITKDNPLTSIEYYDFERMYGRTIFWLLCIKLENKNIIRQLDFESGQCIIPFTVTEMHGISEYKKDDIFRLVWDHSVKHAIEKTNIVVELKKHLGEKHVEEINSVFLDARILGYERENQRKSTSRV